MILPAAGYAEVRGHDHQPRGPGQHADPQGDAARHRPARLGDRRRPGLPPRPRPGPRVARADLEGDRGRGPGLRRRHARPAPRAEGRDGVLVPLPRPAYAYAAKLAEAAGPVRGRHRRRRGRRHRGRLARGRPRLGHATRRSTPPASPARATRRWAASRLGTSSPRAERGRARRRRREAAGDAAGPVARGAGRRCRCPPGPTRTRPRSTPTRLRLVATRKLYDRGTLVRHSPSMADLAEAAVLRLNPARVREAGRLARRRGAGHLQPGPPHGAGPARHRRAAARGPAQRQRPAEAGPTRSSTPPPRSPTCGWSARDRSPSTRSSTAASAWPTSSSSLLKTVVAFALLLTSVILMVWFERKVISDLQNRIGPNKAGPWGLLQTLADGLKLILKEDIVPDAADRRLFKLAPYLSVVPAFVTFSVVPLGGAFDGSDNGHDLAVRRDHLPAAGRPADRRAAGAGHVVDRRLRHPAGRLVVGLEVPAARLGAGLGPDGLLRGGPRPSAWSPSCCSPGSLSTHQIVLQQAGDGYDLFGFIPVPGLEPAGHRGRAVRDLLHRRAPPS